VDGRRAGRAVAIAESVVQAVRRHAWDGRPDGRVGLFGPPVRSGNGRG
jgi:hypothetical protein